MKGMLYMAIAALFYSTLAFLLKALYIKSTINAFEVTYFQNILMVIMNYVWMRAKHRDPFTVPRGLRITLILRNFTKNKNKTKNNQTKQKTKKTKTTKNYWTN